MARGLLGHHHVMPRCARTNELASALALVAIALVVSTGCAALTSSPDDAPPASLEDRAPAVGRAWPGRAPPAPPCGEPTPLLVHHDAAGRVDRVHAQVTARGVLGSYLVDTGSLTSFATHSGDERGASARATIACTETSLPIIARLRPGTTPEGLPQSGVLGADLVKHGEVLDLDLASGTLGWYSPAPPPPAGAVVLPVEYRNGWLVASGIRVDGRDVKLVVDTGATNVIVVDKAPRANEVREDTVDGTASPVTLFHADGDVSFVGGLERRIPVDRTDAFATLEGLIASLGGDVDGLLGMTALGRDRVILGRDSLVVLLPQAPPSPL
jgi:hypothetical protein